MTNSSTNAPNAPLGVGSIIGESFSILFANLFSVILMAFIPTALSYIISGMLLGWDVAIGGNRDFTNGSALIFVVTTVIQIALYGLTFALLVQLAYDAKLKRPLILAKYISPALRAAMPVAILSFVVGLLAGFGMIAFIIPGLWIYAVFSVVAPVIVIEKTGFGGMGRSATLTKGYRWPIVGTIIILGICTLIVNVGAVFIAGLIAAAAGGIGIILPLAILTVLVSLSSGLSGICTALIYARLREIKEGLGVDQIAAVFD